MFNFGRLYLVVGKCYVYFLHQGMEIRGNVDEKHHDKIRAIARDSMCEEDLKNGLPMPTLLIDQSTQNIVVSPCAGANDMGILKINMTTLLIHLSFDICHYWDSLNPFLSTEDICI
jgi:hypothetical protein